MTSRSRQRLVSTGLPSSNNFTMATIKIRGRSDPLTIDDATARKIKDRKFGDHGQPKAEPHELVDLGEWSGEYGRITEIEMTKKDLAPNALQEEKKRKERGYWDKWFAQTPEQKGHTPGFVNAAWSVANVGNYITNPPKEIDDKAYAIRVEYFRKNPTATIVPHSEYGDLLPKKQGRFRTALADKMRVVHRPSELVDYPV